MLRFFIFSFLVLATATADQVSGIFTSFDSLVWQKAANYPFAGPAYPSWISTLSWAIKGTDVSPGDTFTLTLPCVFKFTTSQTTVSLSVGSTNYATCTFNPGDVVVAFSQLQCVVSDSVTPSTDAHGTINFPVAFNVGGSALSTDLQDSTCFADGTNTVSYYDGDNKLSTSVQFTGGYNGSPSQIIYTNRVVPSLNKQQHMVIAGDCPAGYRSGSLGIQIANSGPKIDCSSIHIAITNALNAWYLPENADTDFSYTYSCSTTSFTINYQNIPAGYRPFIDTLVSVATGSSITTTYVNNYVCANSILTTNNGKTVSWGNYDNNVVGGNGQAVEVVTHTYTGSTTQVSTMPFDSTKDQTKTIVVDVPVPTTTVTSTYIGVSTSFTTHSASPGSTATVIEYDPVHTTITVSTCSPQSGSSITFVRRAEPGATDTVYVYTGECPVTHTEVETTTEATTESTT
ncbi:uncharacterized protein SPAPADRAFT_140900, partial [Spathaspora passalidarum NRRL Y-27907]